jgi:hypothetical protein
VAPGVRFQIHVGDQQYVDEDEVASRLDEIRARDPVDGAVLITGGEEVLKVEDELGALAYRICAGGAIELANDRHAAIAYSDKPGYVRLDPEGWHVRISGDYLPEVVVERLPLVDGLLDCADRITALLRTAGEGEEAVLEPRIAEARAAVAAGPRVWLGEPPGAA